MIHNHIYCGECAVVMRDEIPDDSIDLTVTSPPYDNLRTYNGFVFPFEEIARQLYRITKPGGVVVWVVGDATIKGSETGTSFRQALYFKEIGFNLHDTMIYLKKSVTFPEINRYYPSFEYMFVMSKSKPKTVHLLADKPNTQAGKKVTGTERQADGQLTKGVGSRLKRTVKDFSVRYNAWVVETGNNKSSVDRVSYKHSGSFPERLAEDHILSWSNPGDVVLDPMCGSGTTLKMAKKNDRQYIGIDIAQEYVDMAWRRVENG